MLRKKVTTNLIKEALYKLILRNSKSIFIWPPAESHIVLIPFTFSSCVDSLPQVSFIYFWFSLYQVMQSILWAANKHIATVTVHDMIEQASPIFCTPPMGQYNNSNCQSWYSKSKSTNIPRIKLGESSKFIAKKLWFSAYSHSRTIKGSSNTVS